MGYVLNNFMWTTEFHLYVSRGPTQCKSMEESPLLKELSPIGYATKHFLHSEIFSLLELKFEGC